MLGLLPVVTQGQARGTNYVPAVDSGRQDAPQIVPRAENGEPFCAGDAGTMKGIVDDRATYTSRSLRETVGLSRQSIRLARKSGIVKPRRVGKVLVYMGFELNRWIQSLPNHVEGDD